MFKLLSPVVAAGCFLLPAVAQADTHSGQFTGASDHITTGGVTVVETADGGAVLILDSDFSLDGAPDPRVGFGMDGEYTAEADVGALGELTGLQVYIVPANIDAASYNEVYIWCRQFNVPLGVAPLN
ncbi:MAG: DM13 domain-containing protein [Pseudomonadota bacterium]